MLPIFSDLFFVLIDCTQKYGFAAAVNLKKVQIIWNTGDCLVNENDIKCDFDPPTLTTSIKDNSKNKTPSITYKQIYVETMKFIEVNKQYLQYPMLYLNSKKPKCNDEKNCKQCSTSNNNNGTNSAFCICETKRRELGNQILSIGQEKQCMSQSLTETGTKLFASDKLLSQESRSDYVLQSNWFAKTYAFVQWQQAMVNDLLAIATLASEKDKPRAPKESQMLSLLTSVHSYFEQLIEYLVLFYSCFDDKLWIAAFYPFIKHGIGDKYCKLLFADYKKEEEEEEENSRTEYILSAILKLYYDENNETKINKKKNDISNEMKGLSIIKTLYCKVYETESSNSSNSGNRSSNNIDELEIAGDNPFDLTHAIYVNMDKMVNNITTQVILKQKMNGYDAKNDDRKDVWADNNDITKNELPVSSFIRLFLIRRIICNASNDNKFRNETQIKDLVDECFSNDKSSDKSQACDILIRLKRDGLEQYMSKWYHQEKDGMIIEKIFNKIVVTKFDNEYYKLVTYSSNSNINSYYQNLMFNANDLMSNMFQYLDYGDFFDGDLFNCSLVSSHWLYHVWNINSIYYVNFGKLLRQMSNYTENDDNNVTRTWQRLVNVRFIYFDFSYHDVIPADIVLEKLSMLPNVEKIKGTLRNEKDGKILERVMQRCKDKIKWYDMRIDSDLSGENQLSPLPLVKAEHIRLDSYYFYVKWYNRCESLELYHFQNISENWCKYVINNCDCSGITFLYFNSVTFAISESISLSNNQAIIKELALKFQNLQRLKFYFDYKGCDFAVLLFWKMLSAVAAPAGNDIKVEVGIDAYLDANEYSKLNEMIDEEHLKINKITIEAIDDDDETDWESTFGCIKKTIANPYLQHLIISGRSYDEGTALSSVINYISSKKSFASLKDIQIDGGEATLNLINTLLTLNMIVDKKLIVYIDFASIDYRKEEEEFWVLFEDLCQNVFKVLMNHKIPINITLGFRNIAESDTIGQCKSIFLSHFNFQDKKLLSKYKQPHCSNTICFPLMKPQVSFVFDDDTELHIFQVSNCAKTE